MQEGRWETVTPSQFQHERDALRHVQNLLPDVEPYRAWSNFTFTAQSGHVCEVDLLVAAPSGLYLIEIKSLNGRLTSDGRSWTLTRPGGSGSRTFDNPLHSADLKAKRLRSLLQNEAARQRRDLRIPYIQAAVFLSNPGLDVSGLPDHQLHWVFGPEPAPGELPPIWSGLLGRPPRDERYRMRPDLSRALPRLLRGAGIARSRRHLRVGSWQLDPRPFDSGPTWQDHLARHAQLPNEVRRIRIYLVERNAAEAERASIARAARREMLALHGISHPGIVQVDTMESHEAGPALIFRHDPRAQRLDHYLAQHGERLDVATRVGMIRQLAEVMAYVHGRHLHHRALSARSVLVTPGPRRQYATEEEAWLHPRLRVSDWQSAIRGADATGNGSTSGSVQITPTTQVTRHLDQSAEAYLAPELSAPNPDPVAMDVFGLGALSYLLLTGQAPAAKRGELLTRLAQDNGLRPSSVADSVSQFMDELVQAATAPLPAQRLTTVAEFLDMLVSVEEELTTPTTATGHPAEGPIEAEPDPLEARPGELVGGGEWRIVKRLGTGSTSRAFLADNERTGKQEVLKVALSDEKASRLEQEAQVLRELTDSRVIRLARPEPIRIGNRTVVALEHAGELTVARKLRDDGRLTVDELETFSDYLFGAVDYLEGEGVTHRDIKPDNIAIRVRPNRTRQLVLFDFSLARAPVDDIEAGTPRYLDPFLGPPQRPVDDAHAERYALAVTLHEMASGELPLWGDDATLERYTEGPPVLAAEAFDPAIRDGLVAFFERSLHRDARRRFESLKDMRDAWQQIFRRSDAARPAGADRAATDVERPQDERAAAQARERAAARATRTTVLEAAGLTPRAVSAAHRLDATTVGDLLSLGSKQLFNLPGLGARTRRELQSRIKQWRSRLQEREPSPLTADERKAAKAEVAAAEAAQTETGTAAELARVGLDAIAALLVPPLESSGRNSNEVEATRLLLGLPDETGTLSGLPPWPQQPQVAKTLRVTPGRIAQVLSKQRRRWQRDRVVQSVRAELVELLADSGRVMGVVEMAAALLARRGSTRTGDELRRAIATAAVRAAVEVDSVEREPRLLTRRHGDRLLVALEVSEQDGPETPAAPALLDYADALGKVADSLAGQEVLPAPATVLRELSAIAAPGDGITLDERRMAQLAAVASERAAATLRLEIYPRDLDPVRSLRLAQAGVVPPGLGDSGTPSGLTPEQVRERVRARFPELPPLPGHPQLERMLREAGFELQWRDGMYIAPSAAPSTPGSMVTPRRSTRPGLSRWTAASPEIAAAARSEQQVTGAASEDGFRALTVRLNRYTRAREELTRRFGARPLNVASLFLAALHELVDARPKPTWETILGADAAEPGSRDAVKLGEYVANAWELVRPRLLDGVGAGADGPLLLHEAAPLARYGAMGLLHTAADRARSGAGVVWLLCPMDDPGQPPRLDITIVPIVTENEWIVLPDAWVANEHRSGTRHRDRPQGAAQGPTAAGPQAGGGPARADRRAGRGLRAPARRVRPGVQAGPHRRHLDSLARRPGDPGRGRLGPRHRVRSLLRGQRPARLALPGRSNSGADDPRRGGPGAVLPGSPVGNRPRLAAGIVRRPPRGPSRRLPVRRAAQPAVPDPRLPRRRQGADRFLEAPRRGRQARPRLHR
jgi:serine/threonine protein kinase